MYLSSVIIKNYGPIKEMTFETRSVLENKTNPIVLIGQNGSGKTLFLSNILHALIEIKRKKYNTLLEVSDNNYYRVGSLNYVNSSAATAYNRIEFTDNASFTEAMTKDYTSFKTTYSEEDYPGISIDDPKMKESGFFESVITPKENVFEKEVFLFFPVERYYTPTWINKNNEKLIYASKEHKFVGDSSTNIVKYNVLTSIEEWLMDVIIDRELYEGHIHNDSNGYKIVYAGRNNNIQSVINQFLTLLFKHKGYESARIAITKRQGLYRQIEIVGRKEEKEYVIMPTMANMSSGEAMVLGIMASILREVDRIGVGNFNIADIKGIVLIDEIDAHMHSDFIQEALPELISFFSGI